MMLTREEQRALDNAFYHLRSLKTETRISTMAVQIDAKRREQPSQLQKSLLNTELDVLRREMRESRRRDAVQFMASRPVVKRPSQRYEAKARVVTKVTHDCQGCQDCYELKKKLPLAARKRFEDEYNGTPYGEEQQLIDKYVRLYRL